MVVIDLYAIIGVHRSNYSCYLKPCSTVRCFYAKNSLLVTHWWKMVVGEWNFSSFKLHTKFYPSAFCILRTTGLFTPDITNLAEKPLAEKRLLAGGGFDQRTVTLLVVVKQHLPESSSTHSHPGCIHTVSSQSTKCYLICNSCRLVWRITEMSIDLTDYEPPSPFRVLSLNTQRNILVSLGAEHIKERWEEKEVRMSC